MSTVKPPENTPEQHSHPDEPRLDPNSYTAHRLHHGTPEHLHLTTRRVFVGPIPIGWLKNHRSEWYKHHLHINYSSTQAAFNTSENVSRKRKLSGLEHRDTDNWWTEGGVTPAPPHEAAATSVPVPIPRSNSNTDAAEAESSKWEGKAPAEQSPDSQRSKARPVSARSRQERMPGMDRGESFATAHESWDSTDEDAGEGRHGGKNRASNVDGADDSEEEDEDEEEEDLEHTDTEPSLILEEPMPMTGYASEGGASTTSTGPSSNEAASSLQSLLKHDGEARRSPQKRNKHSPSGLAPEASTSERRLSILSLTRKAKSTQPVTVNHGVQPSSTRPSRISSNNKERISGGLVRFNTAVDRRERDKELQRKLAELTRNRALRHGGRHSHVRKREGEIVKMENMLVRVEVAKAQLPDDYDENESMKIDTRTMEKWREFVVVCREGMDEDIPMTLQLYKSRVIPAIDKLHVSSHSTREISLNPKTTKVNLYSSLDKTLVIWLPYKRGTVIYIMRPRCSSSSVEWYNFILKKLGWNRPEILRISVPDLFLTLSVQNPFGDFDGKLERNGYDDGAAIGEQRVVAKNLVDMSMNILEGIKEWADILEYWKKSERMGLAWRRYDRLEWVHGINEQKMYGSMAMQKTHDLELRPKMHYPTETQLEDDTKVVEPPPVEGFLIRLTSGKGRQERLGRMFYKRLYFTTHDNYLCFCKPARALPPPPPKLAVHDVVVPPTSQIIDEIPLIYAVAPYVPNKDGDIEWLAKGTPHDIDCRDKEAYDEAERKVNTLLRTEGFIDLCRVTEVRLMKRQPNGVNPRLENGPSVDFHVPPPDPDSNAEDGRTGDINDEKSFELVLDNGLVLRLQSFDERTRDEWVLRLKDLVVYWKARDRDDLAIIRRTRDSNLKMLHVDEEFESIIGQFARKWEVSRTVASAELYNVCGISSCRTITMSGVLYRKPRKHSTFRRYNVVLCHGELLIFHNSYRKRNGAEIPHIHQDKHQSLSLKDCYIYSGLITENDLLYQNQTFDSNAPGRHALPRVYKDGLTTHDEDTMTCFVIWHGMRRGVFKTKDEEGRTVKHRVTQLGQPGKAVVFKARSRLERDTWVMSIAMEIERLNTGVVEDIKVTEKVKGVFS
ncbi:hypothetical protein RUND412_004516 [Rhizina undulata]